MSHINRPKQYAAYRESVGRPLPKVVDISGVRRDDRRAAPTTPPPRPLDIRDELIAIRAEAVQARDAAARTIRNLDDAIARLVTL